MNESEIERQMRTLRPAVPSRHLAEGIARDLAGTRRRVASVEEPHTWGFTAWVDRLLWSGLGAAAAMVLVVLSQPAPHKPAAQVTQQSSPKVARSPEAARVSAPLDSSTLQPVLASEEDMGWHDEGVQFDPHGRPMLKLTRTAVERRAWADLKNAGVVQMEKPRQEVLWVPVALH